MRKFLFLSLFIGIIHSFAIAQKAVALETIASIKDSSRLPQAVKDSLSQKKGFADLFVNDGYSNTAGPRLNPRAVSFVSDYIDKNSKDLIDMKDWGRPYFNIMDAILVSHNLPKELKYLAVIESRLHTNAVSWVGAVGPWQLMPETARLLGLKVSRKLDERTNYVKSTHAASKYLNELYDQFGDWLLVIAAYNTGPGHVIRAIRKSGSTNFWDLQYYLPAETRAHVKKFIGTHYIFEGQGGITTLTKKERDENYGVNGDYIFNRRLNEDELKAAKTQTISGKYQAGIIAKVIVMDPVEFSRYNPDFDKVMASASNGYELKLPADKMESFNANKYQILNESIQQILNNAVITAAADKPPVKDSNVVSKLVKK